jgi:ankyrin repeat protein
VRCLVKDCGADVNQALKSGATPLFIAAQKGHSGIVQCLVEELGADVNKANTKGFTPLYVAVHNGQLAVVRCLVKDCGVDVNEANECGATALYIAAQKGHSGIVQCLVEELGADVNKALDDGATPLMVAARMKHKKVIAYLLKHGADPQLSVPEYGTAANVSKSVGAPDEQTAYLEAKTHCPNAGCDGAGTKKCTGCKQARYCGKQCQLAHWPAHKAKCKEATQTKAAEGE